ncbi:hypothetical protein ACIGZI_32240 [Streptomyces griseus]|uniref:hypothetical protein n=1 Tax=Streptomyces griseus TaxID=1911 RepID=UPI0037D2534D
MCKSNAVGYRTSDVWVAPHTMGERIAAHPFLSGQGITAGRLEDLAPARDGFVYFPTPLHLIDCHPLHGLAWHMAGTGDELTTDIETITATRLLLPLLAAPTKLPRTPYCPNGLITLHRNVLNGYSNPVLFGAPGPATTLALLLAFWNLRRPTADGASDSQTADEDILTVLQHLTPDAKKTGLSGKKKRGSRAPAKRPIRIIREPARIPGPGGPAGSTAAAPGQRWKDGTLRWEVKAKSQNRCPNPHQHRAIIEAGGTCPPVSVPVRAHRNGPKGRDTDPRRTVRILPDRPDRDA